jgi:predicted enzyme involved in methoxymalonyl-ACP biosynthesis
MSCRVLGRGVEQAMLANIAQRAKAAGAKELRGRFIPTPKNGIVRDHYSKLGFEKIEETAAGETVWRLALANFAPKDVPIRTLDTGDA